MEIRIAENQQPIRVYRNPQTMRAIELFRAFEAGYPIARVTAEGPFRLSGIDYAPGEYFSILWITDRGFERFGIEFLPRTPLMAQIRKHDNKFELVDFAIPQRVEVQTGLKPDEMVNIKTPWPPPIIFYGLRISAGRLLTLDLTEPTPHPIPVTITIPTADQIFEQPKEGEPPPPEEPPS